jgi:hypothetical protein
MRIARLGIATAAVAALVPLSATAAFAAPPANDKPDGAIAMTLGQTVNQDTTEATTDAQDARLNQFCGAPFTNASVWYSYTAATDGSFLLDMSQSDYSGGFMVFQGAPSGRSMVGCGPTTLGIESTAGTTYLIMVFSDTQVQGGNLVLSLDKGPPPPKVKVTVNPYGKAYEDGDAAVSGTFSCKNADFVDMEGTLTQIWRRVKITGFFFREIGSKLCDGQVHTWRRMVTSDNGLYAPGTATVDIDAGACGPIFCNEAISESTVKLHPGGKHAPAGLASGSPAHASPRPPAVPTWP